MALPLLLWQLLALAGGGAAFYLEVRELEEKCFIQEIPDGTVVIGARAPPVPALPYPYPEPSEGMEDGARGISSGPREGTDGKQADSCVVKAPSPLPVQGLGTQRRQD